MSARRILVFLVLTIAACGLQLAIPPWMTTEGFSRGRAYIYSPPEPLVAIGSPTGGPWEPGWFGPARIDWFTLIRGEFVLLGIAAGLMLATRKSSLHIQPRQGLKPFPSFGAPTLVVSGLLALAMPLPLNSGEAERITLTPPIGLLPYEMYMESSHGLPAFVYMGAMWLLYAGGLYLTLATTGVAIRLVARRVTTGNDG